MVAAALSPSLIGALQQRQQRQPRGRAAVPVCAVKKGRRTGPAGYVAEDNSGKANIFAVEPRQLWTSSPTSDRAARQGLGGQQGLLVVGGVLALVALVTVGQGLNPPETLDQAAAGNSLESLATIADRIAKSI